MSDAEDWDLMLEKIRNPEATRYEISCRMAAQRRDAERQSAVPAERDVTTTVEPVGPIIDPSPRVPVPSVRPESTHVASTAPVVAATDPMDALIAALEAATDDAERASLLAAASERTRRMLRVRLAYLRLIAETDRDIEIRRCRLAEFTASLDAAPDDDARLAVISAADPKFLAEWRWHGTATDDIRRKRYLQAVGAT